MALNMFASSCRWPSQVDEQQIQSSMYAKKPLFGPKCAKANAIIRVPAHRVVARLRGRGLDFLESDLVLALPLIHVRKIKFQHKVSARVCCERRSPRELDAKTIRDDISASTPPPGEV